MKNICLVAAMIYIAVLPESVLHRFIQGSTSSVTTVSEFPIDK